MSLTTATTNSPSNQDTTLSRLGQSHEGCFVGLDVVVRACVCIHFHSPQLVSDEATRLRDILRDHRF